MRGGLREGGREDGYMFMYISKEMRGGLREGGREDGYMYMYI